jgi:hypothetical protein
MVAAGKARRSVAHDAVPADARRGLAFVRNRRTVAIETTFPGTHERAIRTRILRTRVLYGRIGWAGVWHSAVLCRSIGKVRHWIDAEHVAARRRQRQEQNADGKDARTHQNAPR